MKSVKNVKVIAMLTIAILLITLVNGIILPQTGKAEPPSTDYALVYEDNFDGTSLDTNKWDYRHYNTQWSASRPENVSVSGGNLHIALKKENYNGMAYTGGGVISKQKFQYGYCEIRARLFGAKGWHSSFWGYRGLNEIDGFEVDSIAPAKLDLSTIHYNPDFVADNTTTYDGPDTSQDFHIYGYEWTPTQVKYYVDGQCVKTFTYAPPHNPVNIYLTSIASWLGNTDCVDDSALPGEILFDYCRFYVKSSDNRALNKSVTVDSTYANYVGSNAVDGNNVSDASRWLSANNANDHWIEIPLGDNYGVHTVKFWTGYQGYNTPVSSYKIQRWDSAGGSWVDIVSRTGNTISAVFENFTNLETTKIRLYSTSGVMIKLYEIEVYGYKVNDYGGATPNPTNTPKPTPVVVVDDGSAGYAETGTWSTENIFYYGSSLPTRVSTTQNSTAKWTPNVPVSKTYNVCVYTPYTTQVTSGAKYTVNYNGGSTDIYVNQSRIADRWYKLGTFSFASGTSGNIVLSVINTTLNTRADKIALYEPTPGPTPSPTPVGQKVMICDDYNFIETGTWGSSGLPGFDGSTSRYSTITGSTAKWAPGLTSTGRYNVYVWYPYHSNNTTNAKYTIAYDGGSTDVYVDQTLDGNQWRFLGNYLFAAGSNGSVTLSVSGAGTHRTSAVMFDPVFSDDFEDGNSTGWTVVNGTWSVATDGTKVFKRTDTTGTGLSYAGTSTWANYTVESRIKIYNAGATVLTGILARYSDSSNYYMFRIHEGLDKVQLYKNKAGSWSLLQQTAMTIDPNTWYTLKLVLNGTSLTGYVDDVQKVSVTDSTNNLTTGCIGIRGIDTAFAADDIIVY